MRPEAVRSLRQKPGPHHPAEAWPIRTSIERPPASSPEKETPSLTLLSGTDSPATRSAAASLAGSCLLTKPAGTSTWKAVGAVPGLWTTGLSRTFDAKAARLALR